MLHMRGFLLGWLATMFLSGCTTAYMPAPLLATHPANPAAPEAPPPPPSQAFTGESLPPAPVEETPTQRPHSGHSAMHGGH